MCVTMKQRIAAACKQVQTKDLQEEAHVVAQVLHVSKVCSFQAA